MTKQAINSLRQRQFGKLAVITVAAVYLLILVGGIVRSSGSGMGCPDWPKCFGSWVPPTSADQLPADYKEIYSQKREQKNERFADMLDFFGALGLANQIRHDETILQEADFNPQKTWIEYLNRLTGVVIGLLIIATFVLSFSFRKARPAVFKASMAALILVIFQGWLGSIVVSTNLLPWMVTVHMLPALVIVALLIYAAYATTGQETVELPVKQRRELYWLLIALMGLSLWQIVLGTQVREMVDEVALAHNFQNRESWIEELGLTFYVHRSFSILVLGLHGLLYYRVRKFAAISSGLFFWTAFLGGILFLEILSGVIMAYFAIPAFLQPMHLLFGTALFGNQFYLWLFVKNSNKENLTDQNSEACLLQEAGR